MTLEYREIRRKTINSFFYRRGAPRRCRNNLNSQTRRAERASERHCHVQNFLAYTFDQIALLHSQFGTENEENAHSFDSLTCASLNT